MREKPTTGPRRPANRRRKRNRGTILDAARTLLLDEGPESLTLRRIARRANYTAPALYEYFESKQALVAALAERTTTSLTSRLREVARELRDSPDGPLVEMGLAYVGFARQNPEEFLLISSRQRAAEPAASGGVSTSSPYRALFETVAVEVVSGSLGSLVGQAEQITYGLWAICHGMALLQLTSLAGFDADFAAADRSALRAYVRGLAS